MRSLFALLVFAATTAHAETITNFVYATFLQSGGGETFTFSISGQQKPELYGYDPNNNLADLTYNIVVFNNDPSSLYKITFEETSNNFFISSAAGPLSVTYQNLSYSTYYRSEAPYFIRDW